MCVKHAFCGSYKRGTLTIISNNDGYFKALRRFDKTHIYSFCFENILVNTALEVKMREIRFKAFMWKEGGRNGKEVNEYLALEIVGAVHCMFIYPEQKTLMIKYFI